MMWLNVAMRTIINGGMFCAFVAWFAEKPVDGIIYVYGVLYVLLASFFSYRDGRRDALEGRA